MNEKVSAVEDLPPRPVSDRRYVIALGGSRVVPDEIDQKYLKGIKSILAGEIAKGARFAIVIGGGAVSRYYQQVARKMSDAITDEALDWIGIETTRLNARFVTTVLEDLGKVSMVRDEAEFQALEDDPDVLVSGGWYPGWSTDKISVEIAAAIGAREVLNLSNIDAVYDRDPKKYKSAKPFQELTWNQYRTLFPTTWTPGLNSPFDPIASARAQECRIKVVVMNGEKKNLQKYLSGQDFNGTIVGSEVL